MKNLKWNIKLPVGQQKKGRCHMTYCYDQNHIVYRATCTASKNFKRYTTSKNLNQTLFVKYFSCVNPFDDLILKTLDLNSTG